jgi:ABC-2 type transport system ATP-binding protein
LRNSIKPSGVYLSAGELPVIRAQNLAKRSGDLAAVNGISFAVRRGEILAFLGPNGAGETTTIKTLATLLDPPNAVMELDGLNPTGQRREARLTFGIVFQDPSPDGEQTG